MSRGRGAHDSRPQLAFKVRVLEGIWRKIGGGEKKNQTQDEKRKRKKGKRAGVREREKEGERERR